MWMTSSQAREGRIDNLRRNVMHNLPYCHIQSLPPGFESQGSIKSCVDWHNTLDGPAAYTKLQTFTQTLTHLLKEVAGSWRECNPQFVIVSFTGSGRGPSPRNKSSQPRVPSFSKKGCRVHLGRAGGSQGLDRGQLARA